MMPPWVRGLLDLRQEFRKRVGEDLSYLAVRTVISPDDSAAAVKAALSAVGETGDEPTFENVSPAHDAILKGMVPLPPNEGWRAGRFIHLDELKRRAQTDKEREASGTPYQNILLYRHVLFGNADQAAVRDFLAWAGEAGRYVLACADRLIVMLGSDEFTWLNFMVGISRLPIEACPLQARPRGLEDRDGFRLILPTDVFRASVEAIDTVEHLESKGVFRALAEHQGYKTQPATEAIDKLPVIMLELLGPGAGISPGATAARPATGTPEPERHATGGDPHPDERISLTEAQRNILDAALALGAKEEDSRKPQDAIAKKAGIVPDVGNTGAAFSELVRRGLLTAKSGRRGGTWLTDKGRAVAR
jgi:hypothetical protein